MSKINLSTPIDPESKYEGINAPIFPLDDLDRDFLEGRPMPEDVKFDDDEIPKEFRILTPLEVLEERAAELARHAPAETTIPKDIGSVSLSAALIPNVTMPPDHSDLPSADNRSLFEPWERPTTPTTRPSRRRNSAFKNERRAIGDNPWTR